MIDEADEAMPGQQSSRKRPAAESPSSPRPNKRKPGLLKWLTVNPSVVLFIVDTQSIQLFMTASKEVMGSISVNLCLIIFVSAFFSSVPSLLKHIMSGTTGLWSSSPKSFPLRDTRPSQNLPSKLSTASIILMSTPGTLLKNVTQGLALRGADVACQLSLVFDCPSAARSNLGV